MGGRIAVVGGILPAVLAVSPRRALNLSSKLSLFLVKVESTVPALVFGRCPRLSVLYRVLHAYICDLICHRVLHTCIRDRGHPVTSARPGRGRVSSCDEEHKKPSVLTGSVKGAPGSGSWSCARLRRL